MHNSCPVNVVCMDLCHCHTFVPLLLFCLYGTFVFLLSFCVSWWSFSLSFSGSFISLCAPAVYFCGSFVSLCRHMIDVCNKSCQFPVDGSPCKLQQNQHNFSSSFWFGVFATTSNVFFSRRRQQTSSHDDSDQDLSDLLQVFRRNLSQTAELSQGNWGTNIVILSYK